MWSFCSECDRLEVCPVNQSSLFGTPTIVLNTLYWLRSRCMYETKSADLGKVSPDTSGCFDKTWTAVSPPCWCSHLCLCRKDGTSIPIFLSVFPAAVWTAQWQSPAISGDKICHCIPHAVMHIGPSTRNTLCSSGLSSTQNVNSRYSSSHSC